jgi:hypothetical protein
LTGWCELWKVRDRLRRAAAALEAGGIPYAVVGGNAVAAWVSRVDEAAVRNTRDVDIILRRGDLDAAKKAMAAAGFIYRNVRGVDMFLDGPGTKVRDAVHILFAGEKVRPEDPVPVPDVSQSQHLSHFRIIELEALVWMKLVSFLDKDRTHLRDMIDLGMIDNDWPSRMPPELAQRLQFLLDNPEDNLG